MKKLFTLLSLLCCMTAVWAGTGSDGLNLPVNEDGYTEVRTGAEFAAAIRANNSAKIRLAVDSINVGGLGQICETFSGEIVGGHIDFDPKTGEQIIVPHFLVGKRGEGKGADSPLFNKLEAAHFENVAFMNFRVEDEDNSDLGVVARTAALTTFKNVSTVGVSVFCNYNNAGSIVGYASDCTFDNVRAVASEVTVDGRYAGGVVGRSIFCNFNSCATNEHTHVFADGKITDAAYAGGISGYSMGDHFYDCANLGWVGGDEDKVGGIVGESSGSNFILCLNRGVVLQTSEEYFVQAINDALAKEVDYKDDSDWKYVSYAVGAAIIVVGIALAIVSAGVSVYVLPGIFATAGLSGGVLVMFKSAPIISGHDELGGIAGHAEGGYFEQCANRGFYNAVDVECGGIVGWGSSLTINNCYSLREPGGIMNIKDADKEYETIASIIGYAEGCTVTNNFAIGANRAIGKVKDMNPASGNNYFVCDSTTIKVKRTRTSTDGQNVWTEMVNVKIKTSDYEMQATTEQMMSGQLAYWLNNLHPNEFPTRYFNEIHPEWKLALRPWRQNLTGEVDSVPAFDQTHNAVRMADITTLTHITDAAGLKAFAQRVNDGDQFACAVLDDDIDMGEVEGFTPIGLNKSYSQFRGLFDGLGHTIKGLKVNREGEAGLFGSVHIGAEIRNVIIGDDCEFVSTGNVGVGGIVGQVVATDWDWGNVVIENCANYGTVTATTTANAGGILGLVKNDTDDNVHVYVDNCCNMGTVTAENGNSGLLCGYMRNSGVVSNCWSGGQLRTSAEDVKPYDYTQGRSECFVGYWEKLNIRNCYILNPATNIDHYGEKTLQEGVQVVGYEALIFGELTYRLNGSTNSQTATLGWQQHLGIDRQPVLGPKGLYLHRQLGTEFSSICVPFTVSSDQTVQYYRFCDVEQGEYAFYLKVEPVDSLQAGIPGFYRVLGEEEDYDFCGGYDFQPDFRYYQVSANKMTWSMTGSLTASDFTDFLPYLLDLNGRELQKPTDLELYHAYILAPNTLVALKALYGDIRFFVVSDTSIYDVNLDGEVNVGDAITYINVSNKLSNFTPYCVGSRDDNRMLLSEKIVKGIR